MQHPCEIIYHAGGEGKIYGNTPGICRITGKQASGLPFSKWVKPTFTDQAWLLPGDIISNEALFCFDEQSEIVQRKTGRDKLQRFRTYSHIIDRSGNWHCFTKADKETIFSMICNGAVLVCLTDSGQKHILFKHMRGMWQLDDIFIMPDIELLKFLHAEMFKLLKLGFSQKEIITGNYMQYRIQNAGLDVWKNTESVLKKYRGSQFFTFTSWLLFTTK